MTISSFPFPPGESWGRSGTPVAFQRASDSDRDRVCDQLAMHYSAGRLRPDELDTRLHAAVRAETLIELRHLVIDLPVEPQPSGAPAPSAEVPSRPSLPSPPAPRTPWGALDVLALVAVVGALGTAMIALLVLGGLNEGVLAVAGVVGGTIAALGGASAAHLVHRATRR